MAKLKGIYVDGMQNAQNTRLRAQFEACRDQQKALIGYQASGMDVSLARLSSDMEIMLLDEEQQLRDAKDMAALHGVALGIRNNREKNRDIIKKSATSLRTRFGKWQRKKTRSSFSRARPAAKRFLRPEPGWTTWLTSTLATSG